MQLVVTGSPLGLQITPANLADDDDVLEVHQEFYGIPWDAFEARHGASAGMGRRRWTRIAESARGHGQAGLSLGHDAQRRARPRSRPRTVIDNGAGARRTDDWSTACYDFRAAPDAPAVEQAYLRYVAWMIDEFSPRWLNVAVEVNLFFEKCPAAVDGLVDVANAAYDAAKAKRAGPRRVPVDPDRPPLRVQHRLVPDAALRAAPASTRAYAQIAPLKRDRFAMSTYPMLSAFQTPADLPADWFTRGASRGGERPLVAETGWNSSSIVVQPRGAALRHGVPRHRGRRGRLPRPRARRRRRRPASISSTGGRTATSSSPRS